MDPLHKKYILENRDNQSIEAMARHLHIKEKMVRKFIDQNQSSNISQGNDNKQSSVVIEKKKWLLCLGVLILVGFIVYGNSFNGQFVWDDQRLIEENPVIKNWDNVGRIFTSTLRSPQAEATSAFRPLQTFTYLIDYSLGNLNVFGYHLTSILFHILTAIVLFWMIQLLFGKIQLSFLTSLIFIIHPVHSEAVAYISGRADSMAAFFMVLSFCLYLRVIHSPTVIRVILLCLSFLAALLSRENALILPILILFYHAVFKSRICKKTYISILCTCAVYLLWRAFVFQGLVLEQSNDTTIWQRVPGMLIAFASYIRLMLLPFNLHMEYGGLLFYWNEPKIYLGLILALGLGIFAFKQKANQTVFFALGWFIVSLLPMMNIVPLNSYMAEHWLYIPIMGYCLIAAYFLLALYQKNSLRTLAIILMGVMISYYSCVTIIQNKTWANSIRLYQHTLKFNPESTRLYTNLAGEMFKAGEEEGLIDMLKRAIEIDPDNAVAYNNLGNSYKKLDNTQKAMQSFAKSIEINPNYAAPYYNLGVITNDELKNTDQAIAYLQGAIALDPAFSKAYHKLARILQDAGKSQEALSLLIKASKINPDSPDIYHSLAFTYFQNGNIDKAILYFKKTIELQPQHGEAYKNLAAINFNRGNYQLAIEYADQAVRLGLVNEQLMDALKPYR